MTNEVRLEGHMMVPVRNMVFLNLFLLIFVTFWLVLPPPHSFLSVSLFMD